MCIEVTTELNDGWSGGGGRGVVGGVHTLLNVSQAGTSNNFVSSPNNVGDCMKMSVIPSYGPEVSLHSKLSYSLMLIR